jgi:AmmeMemoRadiSam system protein B
VSDVRPAAVAGSWYPDTADRLAREVDGYLAAARVDPTSSPLAIVAPHAGLR